MPATPTPGPDWALVAQEARIDAVRFTTRQIPYNAVVDALLEAVPGAEYRVKKDKNPDTPKLAHIFPVDDSPIGVQWNRDRSDCYVDSVGPLSARVQQVARDLAIEHPPKVGNAWPSSVRLTRLDGCLDFDHEGAFDTAVAAARAYIASYSGIKRPRVDQRGDWENPEYGRTLYVGSRDSVLLRIYEKGKQLLHVKGVPDASPHHVRVEVEVHPADSAAFQALHWGPFDALGTSMTAMSVILALGGQLPAFVRSRDSGTRSSTVRKLLGMHAAYGKLFWELARRLHSPEAACRVIAATLLQADPTAARLQRMLERGVSAPELQQDMFGFSAVED
jgi:hypothetical protein